MNILELLQQCGYRKFNRSINSLAHMWADDASFAMKHKRGHLSGEGNNERVTLYDEQCFPIKVIGRRCIRWFDSSIDMLANGYDLDVRTQISGVYPHLKQSHLQALLEHRTASKAAYSHTWGLPNTAVETAYFIADTHVFRSELE